MLEKNAHLGLAQHTQSNGDDASFSSARLSFFTAEFTDPLIEQQFRQRDEWSVARQAAIAVMIGAVLNLIYGYSDYIILGAGTKAWLLIGARVITLLSGIAGVTLMLRRPSLVTSGKMPTALGIVFLCCFILVVMVRPMGIQWHTMMMVIITLGFYMFLPNRFINMAAMNIAGMAAFLSAAIMAASPNFVDKSRMILLLSTANMIGMVSAYRFSKLRRREFLSLQMTESANARLRTEVSERQRLAEELNRMATTDELTSLANRRHYLELSSREIKRARRLNTPLTVCVLDVDHFKQINDNFGHAVGDTALRAIAGACRESLREMDILGRFGGEEFTITLPDTDANTAQEVAERLRMHIEELRFGVEDLRLSVTIGLAQRIDEDAIEPLLARADFALYEGKRAGRNRVVAALRPVA